MPKPPTHPISTPVPDLQGIASIAYTPVARPAATAGEVEGARAHLLRMMEAAANYIEPTTYLARHPHDNGIGLCEWNTKFPEPSEHQTEEGKDATLSLIHI